MLKSTSVLMNPNYRTHNRADYMVSKYKTKPTGTAKPYYKRTVVYERRLEYRFFSHFHPYVEELIQKLITKSVPGLLAADTEKKIQDKTKYELFEEFFSRYAPLAADLPTVGNPPNAGAYLGTPHPVKDLDFTSSGAYSVYNWELFFHIPLTIAVHLSKNQRFEDAMRWFHYIFDPTDDSEGPEPQRFWKVKPFEEKTDVQLIEEVLVNLSTGADLKLWEDTFNSIGAWKDAPFRPHVIARYRQTAYMLKAVMAYLDNLIAWGDALFRQDTGESIDEALQIYIIAANILGPKPQEVPKKGNTKAVTYAKERGRWDQFGNVLLDIEADLPFDFSPLDNSSGAAAQNVILNNMGGSLYFCIPRNDKLLGYWDIVADRLYKIHNSLNLQGIFRKLALFEPPIDPALLAAAAAAGLDVGAVVNGLNQPLPLVRFRLLLQKATEICQEVKALGGGILSALEKEDNEAMALLRAKHERHILELTESMKYGSWQEAVKNREGLEKTMANAIQRYIYYERLLGKKENEIKVAELPGIDAATLHKFNFSSLEPENKLRDIEIDIVAEGAGAKEGGKKISSHEKTEMDLLFANQFVLDAAAVIDGIGAILNIIPDVEASAKPIGVGAGIKWGGKNLGHLFSGISAVTKGVAGRIGYQASSAAKTGTYSRREQDWAFQSNTALGEINQIYKQIRAAQIREAMAEKDWKNHQQQIKNAREIEQFLNGEKVDGFNGKKTSTQGFYAWMKRESKGLYGQYFQFAFDVAKKAERALQHELGDFSQKHVQFGYLAGKEGLLAGEKLALDLKRMEMAWYELNRREYEMTKHVSLLQVDPVALIQLRTTGKCTISLPEELFDMDCAGHYFRRIKSVAISIPCISGPYTSVNCTLTLSKSSIRKSPNLLDGEYARQGDDTERFSDNFSSLQSIVTSSAQNDSGMFETNLNDERYLPFEYAGVVSEWQLALPNDFRQFDYDTISDVILQIRYTAREGGKVLATGAVKNIQQSLEKAGGAGRMRLFSIRHEFSNDWAKFTTAPADADGFKLLTLTLKEEHYPFWSKDYLDQIEAVTFFASGVEGPITIRQMDNDANEDTLVKDSTLNDQLLKGSLDNIQRPNPTGPFSIKFSHNNVKQLWMVVSWKKNE